MVGCCSTGGHLYGTMEVGGSAGAGVVFRMHPDGTDYVVLHAFSAGGYNSDGFNTNSDGAYPEAGLTASAGTLYGTTVEGGNSDSGTVFRVNTNGTGFTVLKHFSARVYDPTAGGYVNSDGAFPMAGVTLSSPADVLYGTTARGGNGDSGTVFKMFIDGTGYTVLKHFSALVLDPTSITFYVNDDGANSYGELTLSGDLSPVLYGTTTHGGTSGCGTVFRIKTDGTGFNNLHNFTGGDGITGGDGLSPKGTLAIAGNEELYGTTAGGGSAGRGTVFKMLKDGRDFTVLKHFSALVNDPTIGHYVNDDGAGPGGGVILSGNVLYGTASRGGNAMGGLCSSSLRMGPASTCSSRFPPDGSTVTGPHHPPAWRSPALCSTVRRRVAAVVVAGRCFRSAFSCRVSNLPSTLPMATLASQISSSVSPSTVLPVPTC